MSTQEIRAKENKTKPILVGMKGSVVVVVDTTAAAAGPNDSRANQQVMAMMRHSLDFCVNRKTGEEKKKGWLKVLG